MPMSPSMPKSGTASCLIKAKPLRAALSRAGLDKASARRPWSEGIAARASDIDVIWMNGYGWPAWRGGPMYYADQAGLPYVVSRLETFASAASDESLFPSPVLRSPALTRLP